VWAARAALGKSSGKIGFQLALGLGLAGALLLLPGCASASTGEKAAQRQVDQIGRQFVRPGPGSGRMPLREDSAFADFARYAVLNHPAVAARYQDWRASVESIAPNRALPDPQLVFEADFTNTLLQFMPGLMFNLVTPGKREAMAREATESSRIVYMAYVSQVLTVAADLRKSWVELGFIDGAIALKEASLAAVGAAGAVAEADYATGRGMSTLESPMRFASEADRLRSELATLGDRRAAARAGFKSALGLLPTDPDPLWPHPVLAATPLPPEGELWRRIQTLNPGLAQMRAMVDMAMASVAVARTAGTPDYSLGAMEDLRANPLLTRPLASMTLPIWRSKIAGQIATAQARRDAAAARVSAEQLAMAAQLAQMLAMIRESDRMVAYIDGAALPNFERSIATVEAGYQSGMTGMGMIPETKLMVLAMKLDRLAALKDREDAVAGILLMTAGGAPMGSPLIAEPDADAR
jgi:outer membrane protein TolC